MSGLDNYGELIDTQDFPLSRAKQSPFLCHFHITPPPWLAASMQMAGSLTFSEVTLENGQPGSQLTNAGEISVQWFPIGGVVEAAIPNGIKNGYINFPKVAKKYKRLRDWKWMFHRLATQSKRTVLELRGPFDELLEELEEFQTPPLGSAATPQAGTMSPCSSLDDDMGSEVRRWDEEHAVDIETGQGQGGQYRLEPPTHRSFRKEEHAGFTPQAIPHLGPMLETTIGPTSRTARGNTLSPTSGKSKAQTEPDTSKGVRLPAKRRIFIGLLLFLVFFHWIGLTVTFKQNPSPIPTPIATQDTDFAADYE